MDMTTTIPAVRLNGEHLNRQVTLRFGIPGADREHLISGSLLGVEHGKSNDGDVALRIVIGGQITNWEVPNDTSVEIE